MIVDLDEATVSEKPKVAFPKKETNELILALKKVLHPHLANADSLFPPQIKKCDNRTIRELFLVFFKSIVGSVEEFVSEENFNKKDYLLSRPEECRVCNTFVYMLNSFKGIFVCVNWNFNIQ